MASSGSFTFLILVLSLTAIAHGQELSTSFYDEYCPNFQSTVESILTDIVEAEPRMGASLLRLHFHDCFVTGCDGSVLLDIVGGEKESVHNINSLRGFEVIDIIKEQLETICPGIVSCADILALAAKESVVKLGGPSWNVLFGRRDSTTSATAATTNGELPFGNDDVQELISFFDRKGFSIRELVTLSGAHTIGQARCVRFRDRIYNESNIDPTLAQSLKEICPRTTGEGNDITAPLDFASPVTFNNDYYIGLTYLQGLLHSDQVLFSGARTDEVVQLYANSQSEFFTDFAAVMYKMSQMDVITGQYGIIRTNCRIAG